ncbi:major facilitator superfamily-like protein [Aureococcus anophagefferens]|nr:major facilitator superfamily-like protein [Aureococcus anophagefferens]
MCPRPLPGDAGAKPAADDRSEPGESAENAAARATNLRVAYAFTLLAGVARGVWSYSVLSGYLYVLTGIRTSSVPKRLGAALETIFADSTHRGERRAAATTRKFVLTLAATCAGRSSPSRSPRPASHMCRPLKKSALMDRALR